MFLRDDPERRPLGERCLLGFGSTAGPPALPDYFYNNLHQIVQTKDSIMILTGNGSRHVRVVRMNAQHLPPTHPPLAGRFSRDTGMATLWWSIRRTSPIRRVSPLALPKTCTWWSASHSALVRMRLLYKFTVEDPATWDKPWSGEYTLARDPVTHLRVRVSVKRTTRWPIS